MYDRNVLADLTETERDLVLEGAHEHPRIVAWVPIADHAENMDEDEAQAFMARMYRVLRRYLGEEG